MYRRKPAPEYAVVDPDFKPLPKYGHFSEPTPEFTEAKAGIDAIFTPPEVTDFAILRALGPAPDAVIPAGGPDRSRDVVTEKLHFPARDGHMVELKVYRSPKANKNATLMIRMHGGGWVFGDHEMEGAEHVHAAAYRNLVVVSVDYRMAPEHPFPQAVHDSYDALIWCKNNPSTLGIDPEKIIVGGSSAGGNLAAVLALEARDNGVTGIVAQVLHFSSLCHPKFFPRDKYEFGSYMQNANTSVVDALSMEFVLDIYVPNAEPDQRHSPLLAKSLKGLPPALIQCGGLDVLRDDDFAYAEALKEAGVEVEIHCYKGLPHVFPTVLPAVAETQTFYSVYNAFLDKFADRLDGTA